MEMFSPKIEIINHFDNLVQQIDIDIEECLKKYKGDETLSGEQKCFKDKNTYVERDRNFRLNRYNCYKNQQSPPKNTGQQTAEILPESTKVVDYLSQIRMRTIEELRKAQEESLEYYRLNSASELTNEEKKCQLFADKFYFQIRLSESKSIFNLFTFVTDFHMSQSDIDLLEKFINTKEKNESFFRTHSKRVFDDKMVLIGLLYEKFCDHLNDQKLPNQMIYVSKQELLEIEEIDFNYSISKVNLINSSIDFSKLLSLKIRIGKLSSIDKIVIKSLTSLVSLSLLLDSEKPNGSITTDNNKKTTDLFDSVPKIEIRTPNYGRFKFFEFDKSKRMITLYNMQKKTFNCDILMEKLGSNQIEKLCVFNTNIESITKLLSKYDLIGNLKELTLLKCDINRIEKKFIDGFPAMIESLTICSDKSLGAIDKDAFSHLKQLKCLSLCHNHIETLDSGSFSGLINLESLTLHKNLLKRFDEASILSGLSNLKKLNLSWNRLESFDSKSFASLENLEEIDLSINKIEKIDHEAFSNLKRLVCLNLGSNNIESVDREHFSGLVNLEKLYLNHNRLKRVDEDVFSDLKNLKELFLAWNELDNLDAKLFAGFENLTRLFLNSNRLSRLDAETFSDLKNLKELKLNWNQLENLDSKIFAALGNLEEIDLSCNCFKRLDANLFSHQNKKLKIFSLSSLCDADLKTLDVRSFFGLENLENLNGVDLDL